MAAASDPTKGDELLCCRPGANVDHGPGRRTRSRPTSLRRCRHVGRAAAARAQASVVATAAAAASRHKSKNPPPHPPPSKQEEQLEQRRSAMGASVYGAVLLFALALAVAAAETKRPEEPTLPTAAGGDAGVVAAAGRHNVTIFAPRNEAMERDLDPEFKRFLLEPRSLKSVQTLLLFHVLPARHPAGSWPAASHPTLSCASLSSRRQGRTRRRSLCLMERKRKEKGEKKEDREVRVWWARPNEAGHEGHKRTSALCPLRPKSATNLGRKWIRADTKWTKKG